LEHGFTVSYPNDINRYQKGQGHGVIEIVDLKETYILMS